MKFKDSSFQPQLKVSTLVGLAALVLIMAIAAQNLMRSPTPTSLIEDVTGTWSGIAHVSDGTELEYQLTLIQSGTDVRGKAQSTSSLEETYAAYAQGSYIDGVLTLREFDEVTQSNICYWELTLSVAREDSLEVIAGSYEDIRNTEGTCTLNGDVRLSRK